MYVALNQGKSKQAQRRAVTDRSGDVARRVIGGGGSYRHHRNAHTETQKEMPWGFIIRLLTNQDPFHHYSSFVIHHKYYS